MSFTYAMTDTLNMKKMSDRTTTAPVDRLGPPFLAVTKGAAGGKFQVMPLVVRTLPNVIKLTAAIFPDKGIINIDANEAAQTQTYAELYHSAKCVLGGLRSKDLSPGDEVVLQVEEPSAFLSAFWGAILGGYIPVPLPTPEDGSMIESGERLAKVCGILKNPCIITDRNPEEFKDIKNSKVHVFSDLRWAFPPEKKIHRPKSDDTAMLMFSSGATGDPKGVILTHKNLLSALELGAMHFADVPANDFRTVALGFNSHVVRRKLFKKNKTNPSNKSETNLSDSFVGSMLNSTKPGKYVLDSFLMIKGDRVSANLNMGFDDIILGNWMPYSHVIGIIMFHLGPLINGMNQITIKPKLFIENPALFLRLIHRYRISYIPLPNFAIKWLTTQITEENMKGIDLSCIKMIGNGSEPVSVTAARKFIDKFSKYGLDAKAMCFGYGMTETASGITASKLSELPVFHRVEKEAFFRDSKIIPATSEENSIDLPDLGAPCQGLSIRIVDDNDNIVHENTVGHIQLSGPTITKGYYNNPSANEDLFCDGWLRTGDMGFLINGQLVITGRLKDIIFVNGQNLYLNDIEDTISQIPGLSVLDLATVGYKSPDMDTESVILFVKTNEPKEALCVMLSHINKALLKAIGIKIDILVPVNEIPRTHTAKIKRFELRKQFKNNEFTNIVTADDAAQMTESLDTDQNTELTSTEISLIAIWKEVIEIEHIGKFENFFNLGGDSLKATKLAARICEEFNIELSVQVIFEHQTVKTMAIAIDSIKGTVSMPKNLSTNSDGSSTFNNDAVFDGMAFFNQLDNSPIYDKTELFSAAFHQQLADGAPVMREVISPTDTNMVIKDHVTGEERKVVMFGANNYLGLANNPDVRKKMTAYIDEFGVGLGGPPMGNGTTTLHKKLDKALARMKGTEDAVIYSSGFAANLGWLTALVHKNDVIIHDELAHSSIVEGARISKGEKWLFAHNDVADLEKALIKAKECGKVNKYVAIEGVYSMDGDVPPLDKIYEITKAHGGFLVVDDAHGTGVIGKHGHGIIELFGLEGKIDLIMGSFSKALASSGGFLAGKRSVIDYLRFFSKTYLFSASLAPVHIASILAGIEVMDENPQMFDTLRSNVDYLVKGMRAMGLDVETDSAIIPIYIPNNVDIVKLSREIELAGIFLNTVVFPIVTRPRIRVSVMSTHTQEDMDSLLHVLDTVGRECGLMNKQ
ncbi:MAG: aminotransferase class I/II-fold pyridoxal phosphate-dependent enzyme [Proteobacteria bacterium]|nr:aminotransferase class I/II-fold pyridoxal phosphate-dependent enzyme [Pseudomonadota bacterium]